MRRIILPPATLPVSSTTAYFMPGTLWMPDGSIVLARSQWEIYAVSGNAQCAPAYQVATNIDAPGVTQYIDPSAPQAQSVKDVYYPSDFRNLRTDGTAPLKSSMLVRFGWLVSLSSGSTLAFICAGGVVEVTDE
jgi:hypothetical protein